MKYFNIVERHAYHLKLELCPNIENLSDSFMTEDQMALRDYPHPHLIFRSHTGKFYLVGKIVEALNSWIALIKPGSACTSIQTPSIRLLQLEVGNDSLNDFIPHGYHVSGERIYSNQVLQNQENDRTEKECTRRMAVQEMEANLPYKREDHLVVRDHSNLLTGARQAISAKYKLSPTIPRDERSTIHIAYAKRLVSWDEIRKQLKIYKLVKEYKADLPFIKQIWDDPEAALKQLYPYHH